MSLPLEFWGFNVCENSRHERRILSSMGIRYLYRVGTLYSTVNIPYGSMASVMTSDPVERTRLSTWEQLV